MQTLLITGGSGFLGGRIGDYFQGQHGDRYQVFMPGHGEMDITAAESVEKYMMRLKPDVVIHCAAVSDVGACGREPQRSWQINVTGSENIARVSRDVGAKCILCSSDQVYFGSSLPGSHAEDEKLEPGNEYGRQKLFAEQSCLKLNPDSVCLRLSWMYDATSRNSREHGDFLRTLLDNMRAGRELSFPINDVRGITDVRQVVSNLEKTFALPGGVYNFGSPNDRNTFETMRELFSRLHYDAAVLRKNEEAFSDAPRDISMDMSRLGRHGITFTDTVEGLYNIFMHLGTDFYFSI